jgi:hypothetical protein
MNNDAEAQEIHGTVAGSARFPDPAADDRLGPSDAADRDEPVDPEDEDNDAEDDVTDPAGHAAVNDRGDDADDEVIDPDAVIVEETDAVVIDRADAEPADADAEPADADAEPADADAEPADAEPGGAEAPEPVAGFARTPVASPPGMTAADAAGADAVPEADVIAEAARPGVPRQTGVQQTSGPATDPQQMLERWSAIQAEFVDDPRASVAEAAEFVSESIAALVASLRERERALRGQWERDGADTEALRNTLRGYRGLLNELTRS